MTVLADEPGTTDKELVLQCQRGDRASFQELYRRYQKRIRSTLYQLCGEGLLDDLVQEVFLRAWKGLPKLRQASYFSTWIYRISWNVAAEHRRRLAKYQQPSRSYSIPNDSDNLSYFSRLQDTPDLMQLHYQDLVQRGLQSLSLDLRAVIVLHDLEDLPQKEVAKILKIPVGTVKSRLFNARQAIRKFFQQQGVSL